MPRLSGLLVPLATPIPSVLFTVLPMVSYLRYEWYTDSAASGILNALGLYSGSAIINPYLSLIIVPDLSIYNHMPLLFCTRVRPLLKSQESIHLHDMIILPDLSTKPHIPFSSLILARPSLKLLAYLHLHGITTFPVLSMKPYFSLSSRT